MLTNDLRSGAIEMVTQLNHLRWDDSARETSPLTTMMRVAEGVEVR